MSANIICCHFNKQKSQVKTKNQRNISVIDIRQEFYWDTNVLNLKTTDLVAPNWGIYHLPSFPLVYFSRSVLILPAGALFNVSFYHTNSVLPTTTAPLSGGTLELGIEMIKFMFQPTVKLNLYRSFKEIVNELNWRIIARGLTYVRQR